MTWLAQYQHLTDAQRRTEKALSLPIGMASPLWLAFGAAASAGMAWWWMTRWAQASQPAPRPAPPMPANDRIMPAPAPVPIADLAPTPEAVLAAEGMLMVETAMHHAPAAQAAVSYAESEVHLGARAEVEAPRGRRPRPVS